MVNQKRVLLPPQAAPPQSYFIPVVIIVMYAFSAAPIPGGLRARSLSA